MGRGRSSRLRSSVRRAGHAARNVALVLALSATVNDDRVTQVLGADAAIWSIEAPMPTTTS
jgi:hypothetical protein